MTAAGQHLDFGGSRNFQRKMKAVSGLEDRIKASLKEWPHAGTLLCGQVREVKVVFEARVFAVVYLRRGQQVRLLDVFEMPDDGPELEDYRVAVKELFCGGKP